MSDKFLGKYRNESIRLQSRDYSSNGAYFITMCTKGRECFFGEIENGKMNRNEMGNIAHEIWEKIPEQFSFIELGEFVVMPDHVHGVLVINHPETDRGSTTGICGDATGICRDATVICRDAINRVPTNNGGTGGITGTKNPMFHENISRVVRWYKGRCSFEIRKIHSDFGWQSRFHDHIIRNSVSHKRIGHYIKNNPVNWGKDKLKEIL